MDFNDYQSFTRRTAIYPMGRSIEYLTLGLLSEAGEIAGKAKKALRDDDGTFSGERKEAMRQELGDVLWYVSELATALEANLGDVATDNMDKLLDRQGRGMLGGDGDDR